MLLWEEMERGVERGTGGKGKGNYREKGGGREEGLLNLEIVIFITLYEIKRSRAFFRLL